MDEKINPPYKQWRRAEAQFQELPLKNGEFTIPINPKNGQAYHIVACRRNKIIQTTYIDGYSFPSRMKRVTLPELEKRKLSL